MRNRSLCLALALFCLLAACSPASIPATATLPLATPTLALPTFTPAPTVVPTTLYVDAAQDLGPISPLVYGTNIGPWTTIPLDTKPQAVAAGLSYLRFPGGNWGDQYDMNEQQIDDYIKQCKLLGSEPSISVRLKGGSPEKAAKLVEYINITKGYKVRYWSIGNEPSLYHDYDTVLYNQQWRAFAQAMRAVDPSIILVGPDIHQYTANPAANPKDTKGRDWMDEFLKTNGDMVDIISIHRYAFPTSTGGSAPTIPDLRSNSQEWDKIIPALRQRVRELTGRDLPVAVTEVNSSWSANMGGDATMDSYYNAIWWGDSLGRMIRQGTTIVAQFAINSDWGLLQRYDVNPIYYVYPMYKQFGTELVYASSPDPLVSLFAAKTKDGALTLMLINLGPDEKTLPLKIDHFILSGQAQVLALDHTHKAELGTAQDLSKGSVTLPPESMLLYTLAAGK
jgi:hypothetical protein